MKKKLIVSFIYFTIVSVCLVAVFTFAYFKQIEKEKTESIKGQDRVTKIENENNVELAVNDLVEQSKYNIVILPIPNCENNICEIGFKNPINNRYKSKLKLKYKDEYLYESEFISPSYQLSRITLNKKLPKGKYPVLGIITVDVDGVLNNINVEMSLNIK